MEPPLTDILYSGRLIIQDKMLRFGLNLHYLIALRNANTLLFRNTDRFCGPASTQTVQNSLDNADAGRPLAQDCPASLVDSPTRCYTNTGTHSSSLWLIFLAIIQQRGDLEQRLLSTQRHEYPLPRPPEIYQKPPKYTSGHFRWHQWCPHYRVSTVVRLLCFEVGVVGDSYMNLGLDLISILINQRAVISGVSFKMPCVNIKLACT